MRGEIRLRRGRYQFDPLDGLYTRRISTSDRRGSDVTNAAIAIDKAQFLFVGLPVRLVVMLMVTKMPTGRRGSFMLAIRCRTCPGKLERQDNRKENEKCSSHRRSIAYRLWWTSEDPATVMLGGKPTSRVKRDKQPEVYRTLTTRQRRLHYNTVISGRFAALPSAQPRRFGRCALFADFLFVLRWFAALPWRHRRNAANPPYNNTRPIAITAIVVATSKETWLWSMARRW